jgi:hypothetical protein
MLGVDYLGEEEAGDDEAPLDDGAYASSSSSFDR